MSTEHECKVNEVKRGEFFSPCGCDWNVGMCSEWSGRKCLIGLQTPWLFVRKWCYYYNCPVRVFIVWFAFTYTWKKLRSTMRKSVRIYIRSELGQPHSVHTYTVSSTDTSMHSTNNTPKYARACMRKMHKFFNGFFFIWRALRVWEQAIVANCVVRTPIRSRFFYAVQFSIVQVARAFASDTAL